MDFFGTLAGPFFQKLLFVFFGLFVAAYLIYKLQSYFQKDRRYLLADKIESAADIRAVLKRALQQKCRFKVRLNARKRSFNSSLVQVTPSALIIDALFPEEGNMLIPSSRFLEVDFVLREAGKDFLHIPYTFRSSYIHRDHFKGYPAIRIALPELIKRIQRRDYLRIDPPVKEPIYISFTVDENQVSKKIANISGGGVGFYTNLGKGVLWHGRRIDDVTIKLPDRSTVICSIAVQSISQSERPVLIDGKAYYYFCGAEYVDMPDNVREEIIQYIIEKERDELKRLSRGYA